MFKFNNDHFRSNWRQIYLGHKLKSNAENVINFIRWRTTHTYIGWHELTLITVNILFKNGYGWKDVGFFSIRCDFELFLSIAVSACMWAIQQKNNICQLIEVFFFILHCLCHKPCELHKFWSNEFCCIHSQYSIHLLITSSTIQNW